MTKEQLRRCADRYLQIVQGHACVGIFGAYKCPSSNKVLAFSKILNAVYILPWHTPVTIMSHNCQTFTVAYCYIVAVNDVDVAYFVYRTASNTYKLQLNPDEVPLIERLCV